MMMMTHRPRKMIKGLALERILRSQQVRMNHLKTMIQIAVPKK